MQTNKSRPGSLNVPRKTSLATTRTGRKLKTQGSDSDSLSSPSPVTKTPKDRSPNVVDRWSPRSPAAEKKKPTKVSELESQLGRLQDELKKAKDQLSSSESCKKKAQQEADEAKSQLTAILAELEKSQKQLNELSDSEDARIQELRKISQDRDKAWQSEVEAVQKQHVMDSAALASALNEIQRLRISEARHAESAHAEIHSLRVQFTETLELVENLKSQLNDSRESEEEVGRAQVLLEVVKNTEETFKLENGYVMESYKSLLVELKETKSKVNSLEGLVSKFQADFANATKISAFPSENGECLEMTVQIKDTNELVNQREADQSSTKLIETEFLNELNKSESVLEDLKASLLEKEMRVQSIMKENKTLRSEIMKKEIEKSEEKREALMKLGNLTEEADKSSRKAARLTEQLGAAQAASSEMEAELRRLKVQSDQWRKAAEAAAAMLSIGNNGKYVEKMGILDYQRSPFSDDELSVKKNGSVLKKFGVLLKKGQK